LERFFKGAPFRIAIYGEKSNLTLGWKRSGTCYRFEAFSLPDVNKGALALLKSYEKTRSLTEMDLEYDLLDNNCEHLAVWLKSGFQIGKQPKFYAKWGTHLFEFVGRIIGGIIVATVSETLEEAVVREFPNLCRSLHSIGVSGAVAAESASLGLVLLFIELVKLIYRIHKLRKKKICWRNFCYSSIKSFVSAIVGLVCAVGFEVLLISFTGIPGIGAAIASSFALVLGRFLANLFIDFLPIQHHSPGICQCLESAKRTQPEQSESSSSSEICDFLGSVGAGMGLTDDKFGDEVSEEMKRRMSQGDAAAAVLSLNSTEKEMIGGADDLKS
jgi:hypothetical protein